MNDSDGINDSTDDNFVTASVDGISHLVKKDIPALKNEYANAKEDITSLASDLKKEVTETKEGITSLASDLKKEVASTKEELSSFVDDFKEVKSAFKDMFKLF